MTTDAKGEHTGPRLAFRVSVAEAEHDEGEPPEKEQAIEQRTSGNAACYAEQRTLGSHCCKQNRDKHSGIDSNIAKEAWLAESLAEREKPAFLYHALHNQTAQGKHHQSAVQTVADVTEKPA